MGRLIAFMFYNFNVKSNCFYVLQSNRPANNFLYARFIKNGTYHGNTFGGQAVWWAGSQAAVPTTVI